MRQSQATGLKRQSSGSPARQNWCRAAARWRLIAYIAAILPLLVMIVLVRIYPGLNRQQIPDWEPVISLAEASWKQRDFYQARHLYLQAERIASWRRDWHGLVAAACGMHRLDGANGAYSKPFSILIRAATEAEASRSRRAMAIVAKALVSVGAVKAAAAILARIQPNWPEEANDTNDEQLLEACWAPSPNTQESING